MLHPIKGLDTGSIHLQITDALKGLGYTIASHLDGDPIISNYTHATLPTIRTSITFGGETNFISFSIVKTDPQILAVFEAIQKEVTGDEKKAGKKAK